MHMVLYAIEKDEPLAGSMVYDMVCACVSVVVCSTDLWAGDQDCVASH